MSAMTLNPPRRSDFRVSLAKNRGLISIIAVFACLLLFVDLISPVSLGYYDINSIIGSGAALALASIGQTFVILVGGFDLSAGAVISLVNAFVATTPQDTTAAQIGVVFAGLAVGAAVGAFNGFFVAFIGLQSIVVTLATMFLVRGITLLILPDPGGAVAHELTTFFTGSAIRGVLPAPALVVLGGIGIWLALSRTRFGTGVVRNRKRFGLGLCRRHQRPLDPVCRFRARWNVLRRGRRLHWRPDRLCRSAGR